MLDVVWFADQIFYSMPSFVLFAYHTKSLSKTYITSPDHYNVLRLIYQSVKFFILQLSRDWHFRILNLPNLNLINCSYKKSVMQQK